MLPQGFSVEAGKQLDIGRHWLVCLFARNWFHFLFEQGQSPTQLCKTQIRHNI
jgi:hypothetical protein